MKALALLCVSVLLVGCSSKADSYCGALKDEKAAFGKLATAAEGKDPGYLTDALALFERMRKAAPDDLRDEWDTVVFAWSDLVDVLRRTGVDPKGFDPAKRPYGVSAEDFDRIKAVAAKLSSQRVLDAVSGISQQARDACDIDLSL
jgi:hypothetical protein